MKFSYMASTDTLTICDLAIFVIISELKHCKCIEMTVYNKLNEWFGHVEKALGDYALF